MNRVAAVPATNLLAKISNAFPFNTNATATPIVMIKVMQQCHHIMMILAGKLPIKTLRLRI